MTQARVRIDPQLAALPRSAWEGLIHEANLGDEDSDLARRYFIQKQCQIDIAIDKDMAFRTVQRRLDTAKKSIVQTYNRKLSS